MSKQNKNRIKLNIPINQGKKFKLPETIEMPDYDYPIFCFRHLHPDHNLDGCTNDEKKSLIEKIVKLSQLSWLDMQNTQRHGLGTEKILISSIKPKCPDFITDDVTYLLALRFDGRKPILGHRDRFVFHVIFIDNKFSVYNH